MELTKETTKIIDNMSYRELLSKWRSAPSGDPWFQGETGTYWENRMNELRATPAGQKEHIRASKSIGWGR